MAKKSSDLIEKRRIIILTIYAGRAVIFDVLLSFRSRKDIAFYRNVRDEDDATDRDVDPAGTP